MTIHRVGDIIAIDGEMFMLSDFLDVFPQYDKKMHKVHHYDGKKHYVSDGLTQIGCEMPYTLAEQIEFRLNELRMCRSQREMDHKYFENLRKGTRK